MDNFLYSLNATLPIFILIILGKVFFKLNLIDEPFVKKANKFVFYIALPCLLFADIAESDIAIAFDLRYVLFCILATTGMFLFCWLIGNLFVKEKESQGAFVQASYRSSAAILGTAFILNMYSSIGMTPLMIMASVPLFNVYAIIVLTVKSPDTKQVSKLNIVLQILKNPIIFAIFLGMAVSFLRIPIPTVATKVIHNLGDITVPLALISIGATFQIRGAIKKIKPTLLASSLKLIIIPAIFIPLAIFLDYRDQSLVAALIMLASPTTVSSYVMAKETHNDDVLTSSVIVLTTLLSTITLTLWIFILRSGGFI